MRKIIARLQENNPIANHHFNYYYQIKITLSHRLFYLEPPAQINKIAYKNAIKIPSTT